MARVVAEVWSHAWKAAKWLAFGLLLLVLGGGGVLCARVSRMAAKDRELRCADVARGNELAAALDAMVAHGNRCPAPAMQKRARAASVDHRSEWKLDIDSRDCSYALRTFTLPAWPIQASVRLDYDSRSKKWESVCEGNRTPMTCP
jgi:hypothetical protein